MQRQKKNYNIQCDYCKKKGYTREEVFMLRTMNLLKNTTGKFLEEELVTPKSFSLPVQMHLEDLPSLMNTTLRF